MWKRTKLNITYMLIMKYNILISCMKLNLNICICKKGANLTIKNMMHQFIRLWKGPLQPQDYGSEFFKIGIAYP